MDGVAVDIEGFGDVGDDVLRHSRRLGDGRRELVAEFGQQDHELVPTQARHRVLVVLAGQDALGRRLQQLVAHRVAQAVIDVLEVVQVDDQDGAEVMVVATALQGLRQAVEEGDAVG